MSGIRTRLIFDDGSSYTFPYVFHIDDPKEGMKSRIIDGNRGDGSIVIPGNKESQDITIEGRFVEDGYENITSQITSMRNSISTNQASLKLQHYNGSSWETDWEYTVRRKEEIEFPESLRTAEQKYKVLFKVLSY